MRFPPPAQSQRTPNTHHRPPSNHSWMELMPRAKGSWLKARVLAYALTTWASRPNLKTSRPVSYSQKSSFSSLGLNRLESG